jgi:hypothetical protein
MKIILITLIPLAMAISVNAQKPTIKTSMTEKETKQKLNAAQEKTKALFREVEERGLIVAGKPESQLVAEIVKIADEKFRIERTLA